MYLVTVHDSLSGDPGPMVIEGFNTLEEAYSYGGMMFEEVAIECQDDRLQLRPIFRALAEIMRMGGVMEAGLDGYEVRITDDSGQHSPYGAYYEDVTEYTSVLSEQAGASFLQHIMAQADSKHLPWINKCYAEWCAIMHQPLDPKNKEMS